MLLKANLYTKEKFEERKKQLEQLRSIVETEKEKKAEEERKHNEMEGAFSVRNK